MAVVVMTMQELSLPQRLWIHRSIFGQHNLNYYNSEPFGGDTPSSASVEEWKDYQRRALNEEAQALAMLVSGITLEINRKRVTEGATSIVPKFDSTEKNCTLNIKLSIPKILNGDIILKIIDKYSSKNSLDSSGFYQKTFSYRKKSKTLEILSGKDYAPEKEINIKNGSLSTEINYDISLSKKSQIEFNFFEEENPYIPMASDRINV